MEDAYFPRGLDGEFEESGPDYFDENSFEHLREFYDRLRTVYRSRPGGMTRVVWGMEVLLSPANRLVDPGKDFLAPHPAIRWVGTQTEGSGDEQ